MARRKRRPLTTPHLTPDEVSLVDAIATQALEVVNTPRHDIAAWCRQRDAELATQAAVRELRKGRTLPYLATGGVAATVLAGWVVAEVLTGPAGSLLAHAATPAAAAVALLAVRGIYRERIREWSATYKAGSVAAVATLTVAAAGPLAWHWTGALLVAGGAAVSAGWMRAHRATRELPAPPDPPATGVVDGEIVEVTDVGAFADLWAKTVARHDGPAPKVRLSDGVAGPDGELSYQVTLGGSLTLPELQSKVVRLAQALNLDPRQLVFDDPDPDPMGWRSAQRAKLTRIVRSPITGTVRMDRPRWMGDGMGIGPWADGGDAWAKWVLLGEDSVRNGVVIGSTGSGKSAAVNSLVLSARAGVPVVTAYLDPKGNSSPDLAANATIPVLGLDRAEEFTAGVETLIRGRGLESGIEGWEGFEVSPARPIYLVVIDECDMLFALPGMAPRYGVLAKTGRALGVAFIAATQLAGILAFGSNEMLRSSLLANILLMRTASGSSGGQLIAPGMPDSRSIPQDPGLAYLRAEGSRRAMLRAGYLPSKRKDPHGWNSNRALRDNPDAPMDAIGQAAFAAFLGGQEERRERDLARMRQQLAALLAGVPQAEVTARHPAMAAVSQLNFAGVADRLRQNLADTQPKPGQLATVTPLNQRTARERVLDAVRAGHTSAAKIREVTGLRAADVSDHARALERQGLVRDGGYGVWLPGDQVAAR